MCKVVVIGGDSFVERSGITWPTHLVEHDEYCEGINVAYGGVSNKFIRMATMWGVNHMIEWGVSTKDMLVVVSWSGPSRSSLYTDEDDTHLFKKYGGFKLDTKFTMSTKSDDYTYMPLCSPWDNPTNETYYNEIENERNSIIDTLHDILSLQQFLKNRGINYMMTTSWNIIDIPYDTWNLIHNDPMDSSIGTCDKLNLPEYSWIKDMIDWGKFIPIKGQWEWTNKMFEGRGSDPNSHHPLEHEHKDFANNIVIPFLKKLYG